MADSTSSHRPFFDLLRSGVVVFDGAMGTMIYAAGVPYSQCFDALNVTRPDLIRGIHEAYVKAGAQIIETNTFGANRFRLGGIDREQYVRAYNEAGVRLARESAAGKALVAGSMGPLGKHLEPIGQISPAEAAAAYREQAEILAGAGVDLLVLETLTDLQETLVAVRAIRDVGPPVVALMTFNEEAKTLVGDKPQEVARALSEEGVTALGANCSVGPQVVLEALEKMVPYAKAPLVAMPNAGLPSLVGGRYFYLSSPEYMAEFARKAVETGASLVGGCCGTTPEHIAAMAKAVQGLRPGYLMRTPREVEVVEPEPVPPPPPPERARRGGFYDQLGTRFAISVEMDPPRGLNVERFVKSAVYLRAKGADAINVADSPLARPRMSPTALSYLLQRDTGVEPILHMSCRDRNVLATQSELMGAHVLGIRNILAVTGDPVQVGGYPGTSGVFDLDSVSLVRMISRLNEGRDFTGKAVDEPTEFRIGVAANPTAMDLDAEVDKLRRKIDAGAQFIFTQPVYERATLERFLERIPDLSIPLCVGILPLRSARHAEFLHNEVPGMSVPAEIRRRMARAGDGGPEEGVTIAVEILEQVRPLCQGAYLMPPFNKFEMAGRVLEAFPYR